MAGHYNSVMKNRVFLIMKVFNDCGECPVGFRYNRDEAIVKVDTLNKMPEYKEWGIYFRVKELKEDEE